MTSTPDPSPTGNEPVDPTPTATPAPDKPTSRWAYTPAMRESDLKAIYAVAGVTEIAVGALRRTVSGGSRWASQRVSELRYRREALAKQAEDLRHLGGRKPEAVDEAAEAAKAAAKSAAEAAAEAAKSASHGLQASASNAYSDLAQRGHRALHGVRTDVAGRIDPTFDRLQSRIDAARNAIKTRAVPEPEPVSPVPTAEAPVVAEPVVAEPVVAEPVVAEPIVTEPVVAEPVVAEPVVVEDILVDPDRTTPEQ
jgi:hypothetical protein